MPDDDPSPSSGQEAGAGADEAAAGIPAPGAAHAAPGAPAQQQLDAPDAPDDPGGAAAALLSDSATAGMDPDHPLLQRAQRALRQQLEARRAALDGELKEKRNALKVR